jgi:transposase-like protein
MNPAEPGSHNGSQRDSQNGSAGGSRRERRHLSGQQKVAIVKRHLVDGVPVSDLCDLHEILPTQFYQWQKQLFECGAAAFERKAAPAGSSPAERKVRELEAKLATKNEVIAELLEDHVRLKKVNGEP